MAVIRELFASQLLQAYYYHYGLLALDFAISHVDERKLADCQHLLGKSPAILGCTASVCTYL